MTRLQPTPTPCITLNKSEGKWISSVEKVYSYNGLGTVNVSDVMVLFGTACVIYFIINFTLSCVVRAMQNRRRKALVFAPAKAA